MAIQRETVKKFQKAITAEYGKAIPYEEAFEILTGIVDYYSKLAEIDGRINSDEAINEKLPQPES